MGDRTKHTLKLSHKIAAARVTKSIQEATMKFLSDKGICFSINSTSTKRSSSSRHQQEEQVQDYQTSGAVLPLTDPKSRIAEEEGGVIVLDRISFLIATIDEALAIVSDTSDGNEGSLSPIPFVQHSGMKKSTETPPSQ